MKKHILALAAASLVASMAPRRARTHDVAFAFRMGAGFAGDVNRNHPASIVPGLQDSTTPIRKYGDPCIIDTTHNAFRGLVVGDASDVTPIPIHGVLVRDFPVQASSSVGGYGQQKLTDATGAPGANNVVNVLDEGYIMVQVHGATTITKNGDVYVYCAADGLDAGQILGGFCGAAITGRTVKITNAKFRGPADANGIAELRLWAA